MRLNWFKTLIREIMVENILTISDDESARVAARKMEEYHVGSLLVRKEGETIGILTEADIVYSLIPQGLSPDDTMTSTIMSGLPITIRTYSTIEEAYLSMARNRIRHLVAVAEKNEAEDVEVGIISVRDILYPREEIEEKEKEGKRELRSWVGFLPWSRRDRVEKIMTRKPVMVENNENIRIASTLMRDQRISSLLVKEKDRVKGVLSETDIVRKVIAKNLEPEKIKASEVMTSPPITINSSDPIDKAYFLMANKQVRHLVVNDGRRELSIVSARDLLCLTAKKAKRVWRR
ncbi:MAG: CBS domain-containing protein [bacterium]